MLFFIIAFGTAHCSDAMFMLVTLNPDAAMLSFDILSFDILSRCRPASSRSR
jgi:hypothetical protein